MSKSAVVVTPNKSGPIDVIPGTASYPYCPTTVAVQRHGSISNIVSPSATVLPDASNRPWLNVSDEMMFDAGTLAGIVMFAQISLIAP